MEIKEIAQRLVEYCRKGQWEACQNELYADDAVSVEPNSTKNFEKETKGLQAIIEKGRKFDNMVETMHNLTVSDPMVADNAFSVTMHMDASFKGQGRMAFTELCVYQVKDGKVILEQFFV
jgi:hypothetical protein